MNVEKGRHTTWLQEAFLEAGKLLGYRVFDPNGSQGQTGFSPYLFTIKDGQRWTTSDGYLKPALQTRSNLHIALNSQVRKVLFQGKKAVGVQLSQDSGGSVFQVRLFVRFLTKFASKKAQLSCYLLH